MCAILDILAFWIVTFWIATVGAKVMSSSSHVAGSAGGCGRDHVWVVGLSCQSSAGTHVRHNGASWGLLSAL